MDQTDQLLNILVELVEKKLSSQEQTIKNLKDELSSCKSEINEMRKLLTSTQPILENKIVIETPQTPHDLMNINLTTLPSYKYIGAFKEVKRPTNLNELYMVILQSQHLLYELQAQTDNILRRNN